MILVTSSLKKLIFNSNILKLNKNKNKPRKYAKFMIDSSKKLYYMYYYGLSKRFFLCFEFEIVNYALFVCLVDESCAYQELIKYISFKKVMMVREIVVSFIRTKRGKETANDRL